MPRKFNGINQKAASALARKAAAEEQELEKLRKQQEDLEWQDNDKHVLRKQKRKEEKEQKRHDAIEKRAETKTLLERETANMKSKTSENSNHKLTRADIATRTQKRSSSLSGEQKTQRSTSSEPLEENTNRLVDEVEARTVTEAIAALHFQQAVPDKNPEKRMKASYKSFEKSRLEELRQENPELRLSQVKQLLQKEWQKSPLNPLNQLQ